MDIDPEHLRAHYRSLTDEALLDIKRADLVEIAQGCYDDEIKQRALKPGRGSTPPKQPAASPAQPIRVEPGDEEKPDWIGEAAEVFSRVVRPGMQPEADVADARDALEAAGIPCYVQYDQPEPEQSEPPPPGDVWRVLVPGNLNLHAASVLDRDIFNPDFEAEWRTLLETLSDEEVRQMNPEAVFCGMFDRIERVTKAYEEEIARRQL